MLRSFYATLFTSFLLLLISQPLAGQQFPRHKPSAVPVYKSEQDSIRLANLDSMIHGLYLLPKPDPGRLDSLEQQRAALAATAIVRMRRVYYPDDERMPFDSLQHTNNVSTVQEISLSHQRMQSLPRVLRRCKQLKTIELVNCSIRRLPRWIRKLDSLQQIIVLNNGSARPLRLPKNKTITRFTIHGENTKSFPEHLNRLRNLKYLNLSECELRVIPATVSDLAELEELEVQHNHLSLDGTPLPAIPSLKHLALQYNAIKKIPSSIAALPNLERLNCNHNEILEVAPEIAKLRRLEYLSLYNNQLTSIPKGVYALRSLRAVDLYFNNIEVLTNEMGNWKSLEILFIAHNKLYHLPDTITSLPHLAEIYAYHNRIVALPDDIDRLKDLRVLRVNMNFLKVLPLALLTLSHIEELDFADNYLTSLPPAIFNYPDLKILTVVNNPLDKPTMDMLLEKFEQFRDREVYLNFNGSEEME